MKNIKKVLFLFVVVAVIFYTSGCNKKALEDKIDTLTWYVPNNEQVDRRLVLDAVDEIINKKIGANLNMIFLPGGDFTERLQMIMASQEDFDLTFSGYINPYLSGARMGGFEDISKMLKDYPKLKESIPDYLWEAADFEGGIYAVPNYQAMTKCKAIYLKKDLAEKYNLDVSSIKKMTDLEPYLKTILENEPNVIPFAPGNRSMFFDDPYQFEETTVKYIEYDTKIDKLVFTLLSDEYINAEKTIRSWFEKKYIRQDIAIADTSSADLKNGRYAVWTTDGYRPGDVEEREIQLGYDIIPIPLTEYHLNKTGVTTTMTAVSSTSKKPEKALKLLEIVNTDSEIFNMLAFGIKDKHYEKLSGNHISLKPNSGYSMGGNWKVGNIFNGYLLENQDDDLWQQIQKVNNESVKDKYLSFVADTTNINTIISQITTIDKEYLGFENGSADISTMRSVVNDRLKATGYEKLLEETKKQLDEYIKNNK